MPWTELLPRALMRLRALPRQPLCLSPFEIMDGRPLVLQTPEDNSLPRRLLPRLCPYEGALTTHADHLPHPFPTPLLSRSSRGTWSVSRERKGVLKTHVGGAFPSHTIHPFYPYAAKAQGTHHYHLSLTKPYKPLHSTLPPHTSTPQDPPPQAHQVPPTITEEDWAAPSRT